KTARSFANRLQQEAPGDARAQIVRAWRILYGREPNEDDLLDALAYLAEQTEAIRDFDRSHAASKAPSVVVVDGPGTKSPSAPAKVDPPADPQFQALASLCQVFLSSTRFLYVE